MTPDTRSVRARAEAAAPKGVARVGRRILAVIAILAMATLLPLALDDFRLFQLTQAMVYAIALLGLNILTGYNGQISLGHGAFYALGAYTAAILMDRWDVPYFLTLPVAGLLCLVVGFLFGLPALRLHGPYLAVATLALALAVPQFLKYDALEGWTGGVQGIVLIKPEPPAGLPLTEDQWLYLFTLAVMALMFLAAWNLLRGRIGRAMVAIRDHHISAAAMGINTALYKSLTFGVSALYTGVAGALGAIVVQFVAPDTFHFFLSITFLIGIVVGGLASISGAFYGALFILLVPDLAQSVSGAAPWAVYGIFMLLFVYLMPRGIAGFVAASGVRLARFRHGRLPLRRDVGRVE